ncbi:amino acid adenylation domain-containing protein [Amycolatopsis sp. EV170708-02-1]|uniref:non-ribosomal peptide synthetase n=1 Tax=Amycolatopsis sp. EV170708-02-1 TaxID=2919322 RepID=UPI001F0BDE12|nr:amino acid adenylation domain-containing protein [Amycolatopsis sp. EV170708-02-1]UMP06858.1 amino acid adenylation domain-containing protein [Amycolatopsis sp. EV170708-02-1]
MSAPEIVAELRTLGVDLWQESGQIRFRAPRGVLTDEWRAALRSHKAEIVDLLARDGELAAVTHDADARHEPFPLTDVQTAYLLGRRESFGYGGVACHGYLEVSYPELDPVRVEDAWNTLVRRHDMLRAVVERDGYQHVLPEVPRCPVPVADSAEAVRAELGHRRYETDVWPLFALRVTRHPDRDVLHISMDSLIADWASAGVLLDELDLLLADPDAVLPPLEITFRDYLLAERGLRDTARYRADREYWQARVDDLPLAPELPLLTTVEPGPVRFRRHHTRLAAPRWDALREQARRHGITASTAVLAAYAAVLGRWSRRPRFSLNLTLLNRQPLHPQVDKLVGDFTSVSLLAVDDAAGVPFQEWAARMGARMFEDLDHRLFSGVEVMREFARRRDRDAALMPVVFTSAIGLGGRTGSGITQTPQVFLDCQVTDDVDGLQLTWDVREGIFPEGLIEDMFAALESALLRLAESSEAWLSTDLVPLPVWQAEERARVNDTAAPLPSALLHAEVFTQAARTPDAVAVTGPGGALTYGELARQAGGVAELLRGQGIAPGDLVAINLDKGADQISTVLGILLAGGVYLPVDTTQPPLRREKLIAGATHVVTRTWLGGVVPAEDIPVVTAGDPDSLAYVIYTSGSTGDPKGVMITHRAALNTVEDVNRRFGVTASDRVLGLAQLGFDLSVYDIFGLLAVGGTLVLPDPARPADPSHWARLVAEYGVTIWNSVPAQLQMLAHYLPSGPIPIPSLRLALLSGDWIPVTLPGEIRAFAPDLEMIGLGGATEAAIWSIHHPIDLVPEHWTSIPYGVPLANQNFRVLDGSHRDCPVWTAGELYIGGAGLATGYLGDEELTAARFVSVAGERLYRTGDLGRYLPGGEIEFLGREDDQVKIRGHRVELGEVEAALLAHDNVGAAAAVVAGERHGERVLLGFVEPARVPEPPASPDFRMVGHFADRQVEDFDAAQVARHVRLLHQAALASMREALACHPVVHERHRWLARHWRDLVADAPEINAFGITAEEAWGLLDEDPLCTQEFLDYHRAHVERVHELLDGEQNPFDLLFPQGGMAPARAVYRDNPIFRYLNAAAAALLNRIAAAHTGRPLRVLEVGAGTGSTTDAVLPMLAGHEIDYLFTDVSPFFLDEARERFGEQPGVRFGLFDLDQDHRSQGFAPNSFDVVLCAGVLNSVRRPEAVLDLVGPGGWLVFIEPTVEHPHIMLTQGFMMDGPALRSRQEWLDLFGGADLRLPGDGHPQAAQGIEIFAKRVKSDRAPVAADELIPFLAQRLPAHMVPSHLQVVDELPLTGNGKVDRKTLVGWRLAAADDAADRDGVIADELEGKLAALWAKALGLARIGRHDSFYDRGADSLILARVAGQLPEEVPEAADVAYDTLLRQMLNEPTVAALAASLRARERPATAARRDETGNSLLVPFGGGGDSPVRVLFHAALGTMDYFHSLANALVAQDLGPVVGLAVADTDAYLSIDAKDLIERVADDYTDRLLAEGHTRFQLIGYCLGGLLATEVARRLLERGFEVADLSLVDSIPMFLETDEELAFEAIFVPNLNLDPVTTVFGADVDGSDVYRAIDKLMIEHDRKVPAGAMAALTGDPGLEAVAAAVRGRHERTQAERLASYAEAAASQAGIPIGPELVPALFEVCRHSMRAARFDPEPYAGDMTFLRASEQQSFGVTAGVGHLAVPFWQDTCLGEFKVVDVPGNHFSLIEPPHLEVVARHLGAAITEGARS